MYPPLPAAPGPQGAHTKELCLLSACGALPTSPAGLGWAPAVPSSPTDWKEKIHLSQHLSSSSSRVSMLLQEQAGLVSLWLIQWCSSVPSRKYQHWYQNVNWGRFSKRSLIPERCSNHAKPGFFCWAWQWTTPRNVEQGWLRKRHSWRPATPLLWPTPGKLPSSSPQHLSH